MATDKPLDKPLDKPPAPAHAPTHAPVVKTKADAPRAADDPPAPAPVITRLVPATAAVGDPSFALHVIGSGFDVDAVIIFAGEDEETTYLADSELTTIMNMPLWKGPDSLTVVVRNLDGQESNAVSFVLDPPREVPLDPAEPSKPIPAVDQI